MSDASSQLPFRISICGRADLPGFADSGITHIISIDNPESPTPTPGWFGGVHWHVVFHDVDTTYGAEGICAVPPTPEEVDRILAFGKACLDASRTQPVHLLLHCTAGMSRSPAAAYAILCMVLGPGHEKESFQHLLAIRPGVFPNPLVIQYADNLLSRRGQMLTAMHDLQNDF